LRSSEEPLREIKPSFRATSIARGTVLVKQEGNQIVAVKGPTPAFAFRQAETRKLAEKTGQLRPRSAAAKFGSSRVSKVAKSRNLTETPIRGAPIFQKMSRGTWAGDSKKRHSHTRKDTQGGKFRGALGKGRRCIALQAGSRIQEVKRSATGLQNAGKCSWKGARLAATPSKGDMLRQKFWWYDYNPCIYLSTISQTQSMDNSKKKSSGISRKSDSWKWGDTRTFEGFGASSGGGGEERGP